MLFHRGCTWLTLMPLLLSLSTGKLNFYRDALPSEDITLEHLARYLEAQHLQQRFHRSQLSTFLSLVHKKHGLQQDDQKEHLLKILADKAALENLLRQQKLKTLIHHRQDQYNDLIDQIIPEREYVLPYYDLDLKLPYPDEKVDEKDRGNKDLRYKQGSASFDINRDMMEEPIMGFHGKYAHHNHMDVLHEDGREVMQSAGNVPEFTYKFDNMNLEEKHPFAVKPNDPRYYSDAPFSSTDLDRQDSSEMKWEEVKPPKIHGVLTEYEDDMLINQKLPKDLTAINLMEEERTAGHHPLVVPVEHDLNNDIYFIAIVAGCSAAAMFALVLISLTWCRLQRGAKAAADIEYPAYGVTGPNKDVSPSGDQRLAQSAQMYHFQHQKQQIIAMENRASATRDPGSLSEAESDEENEEGDYTVYECPGLASTGEMEVKNPMFHDDPTPVTPAQSSSKEEDHI